MGTIVSSCLGDLAGVEFEVAQGGDFFRLDAESVHLGGIGVGLHGEQRKGAKHRTKEERKTPVSGKGVLRDPAINQKGWNPSPGEAMEPVGPEVSLHQKKKVRLDGPDEKRHNRAQVKGRRDESVGVRGQEFASHLATRAGGGGKDDPRFRKGLAQAAYQGQGRGNLAHGEGVHPEGWRGGGGRARQLTGRPQPKRLTDPLRYFFRTANRGRSGSRVSARTEEKRVYRKDINGQNP